MSIDFGSKLYDFVSTKSYVFCPNISRLGKSNRMLLRKCMTRAGFAPYDAEWWHFSFGDREWAFYYKKSYALYNQLDLKFKPGLETRLQTWFGRLKLNELK